MKQAITRLPFFAVLLGAAPAHAAEGLVLVPEGTLLVVLIAAFAALVFPVNALVFKPLFRVLDEREARIGGARARAAEIEVEANALLERYRDAIRDSRGVPNIRKFGPCGTRRAATHEG